MRTCAGPVVVLLAGVAGCGGAIDPGPSREPPAPSNQIDAPPPAHGFDADGHWAEGPGPLSEPERFDVWVGEVALHVTSPPVPGSAEEDLARAFSPERMTLVIGLDAQGRTLGGTVTFGVGEPPATPRDAGDPYPSDAPFDFRWRITAYPGLEYPLTQVVSSGRSTGFSFAPGELWRPWCALLESRPVPGTDEFVCTADEPRAAAVTSAEACTGTLEQRFCNCDARSCTANTAYEWRADVAFDGDRGSGQFLGRENDWSFWLVRVDTVPLGVDSTGTPRSL